MNYSFNSRGEGCGVLSPDRDWHRVVVLVCSEGTSWISKGAGSGGVTEGDKKYNRFDF